MNQPVPPTVGRIVHYVSYGTPGGEYPSLHRAAIITEVAAHDPSVVSLAVLNPTGVFFNLGVPHDPEGKTGGTWHWPERE